LTTKCCARCGKPLSVKRQRFKYCYHDALLAKREQSEAAHERRVESLYGLRPGEYKKIYLAQGGRCPIKGCKARGVSRRLAVDHDHKLGLHNRDAVRGLLCLFHNRDLGYAGDDPEVFDSMADYLRDPPARKVLTDD
jgi:hypothetical protein